MFSAEHVSIAFDAVIALDDVSLEIEGAEVAGLIGPNGSGKTTLFNCICGYYLPSRGRVRLRGRDTTGLAPHRIARLGVGRTFQSPNLFSELTVRENVQLAADSSAIAGSALRGLRLRPQGVRGNAAQELLRDVGIEAYGDASPLEIPVGIAKLADLARALAGAPKLLLLDEPAAGLNDAERMCLAEVLRAINRRDGIPMLVVDHNMGFVMSLCSRLTVLAAGKVICSGTPAQVRADPAVIRAYLGEESHAGA